MDWLHLAGVALLLTAVLPVVYYVWSVVSQRRHGPMPVVPIATEARPIEVLREVTDEEFEERAQSILDAVQSPKPASELAKQGRSRER